MLAQARAWLETTTRTARLGRQVSARDRRQEVLCSAQGIGHEEPLRKASGVFKVAGAGRSSHCCVGWACRRGSESNSLAGAAAGAESMRITADGRPRDPVLNARPLRGGASDKSMVTIRLRPSAKGVRRRTVLPADMNDCTRRWGALRAGGRLQGFEGGSTRKQSLRDRRFA